MKPVLDALITIEPKKRTSAALLEEVFKKVSIATNTNVGMASTAANLLDRTTTSIGGSGRTARSILEQWILERRSRFSWWLLCEGGENECTFNFSQVAPSGVTLLARQ